MQISDEFVLRILINQASIERHFLARTRAEGDDVLQSVNYGVALTADWFRVIKFK